MSGITKVSLTQRKRIYKRKKDKKAMFWEVEKKVVGTGKLTEKTAPAVRKYMESWIRDRLDMYSNTGKEDDGTGLWLYLSRDYKKYSSTRICIPYGSDLYTDCDGDLHIALPDGTHINFSGEYGLRIRTKLFSFDFEKETREVAR